jgi:hypothetical protein
MLRRVFGWTSSIRHLRRGNFGACDFCAHHDYGIEFCGRPDYYPCNFFCSSKTSNTAPRVSNGFVEPLHRSLFEEHFRIEGRNAWFESIDAMQKVLDDNFVTYITKRRHQGRGMNGRTPITVFRPGCQNQHQQRRRNRRHRKPKTTSQLKPNRERPLSGDYPHCTPVVREFCALSLKFLSAKSCWCAINVLVENDNRVGWHMNNKYLNPAAITISGLLCLFFAYFAIRNNEPGNVFLLIICAPVIFILVNFLLYATGLFSTDVKKGDEHKSYMNQELWHHTADGKPPTTMPRWQHLLFAMLPILLIVAITLIFKTD